MDQLQKDLANEREEKEKVAEEKEHLRHEADQAKDLLLEKQVSILFWDARVFSL